MNKRILQQIRVSVAQQLQMKRWMDYLSKFTHSNNYCCMLCKMPVGMRGTSPAIQVGDRRNKKYKHINCEGV